MNRRDEELRIVLFLLLAVVAAAVIALTWGRG
jgi:hypothetical protein